MLVRWTDTNRSVLRPHVTFENTDDGFNLYADLPGVTADSLDISVEQGVLTVSGTRTLPGETPREVTYRRTLRLSDHIDAGGISAKLDSGVLTLALPRAEQAKPRKITVQAA